MSGPLILTARREDPLSGEEMDARLAAFSLYDPIHGPENTDGGPRPRQWSGLMILCIPLNPFVAIGMVSGAAAERLRSTRPRKRSRIWCDRLAILFGVVAFLALPAIVGVKLYESQVKRQFYEDRLDRLQDRREEQWREKKREDSTKDDVMAQFDASSRVARGA